MLRRSQNHAGVGSTGRQLSGICFGHSTCVRCLKHKAAVFGSAATMSVVVEVNGRGQRVDPTAARRFVFRNTSTTASSLNVAFAVRLVKIHATRRLRHGQETSC